MEIKNDSMACAVAREALTSPQTTLNGSTRFTAPIFFLADGENALTQWKQTLSTLTPTWRGASRT
jgi:hypothetical protein